MELNDALRIPLAPSDVWDALQDLALLRASLDNCESFTRLAHGEYELIMTVPLGPLRARYEARAHVAGQDSGPADAQRRTINFKARAEGIGALRGQIEIRLRGGRGRARRGQGAQHADRLHDLGDLVGTARRTADASARKRAASTGRRFFRRIRRGRAGQARARPEPRARCGGASAACVSAADHAGRHRAAHAHGSRQRADRARGECVAWRSHGLSHGVSRSRTGCARGSELGLGRDDFSGRAAVVCRRAGSASSDGSTGVCRRCRVTAIARGCRVGATTKSR